jgi:hypothetical protein
MFAPVNFFYGEEVGRDTTLLSPLGATQLRTGPTRHKLNSLA